MTTLVGLLVVLSVALVVVMFVDGCVCINVVAGEIPQAMEEYCFNVFDKISVAFVILVIGVGVLALAHKVGRGGVGLVVTILFRIKFVWHLAFCPDVTGKLESLWINAFRHIPPRINAWACHGCGYKIFKA